MTSKLFIEGGDDLNPTLKKAINKSAIALRAAHPALNQLYEGWRTEMNSSDSFGYVADHVVAITSDFCGTKPDKLFFVEMLEYAARNLKDHMQKNP
jgi:hypothetical protein